MPSGQLCARWADARRAAGVHGAKDRAPGARSCPLLNVFILTLACLVCDVPGVQRHSCCFHAYQGHGQPLEVGPVRSRACSLAASVLRAASPCCQLRATLQACMCRVLPTQALRHGVSVHLRIGEPTPASPPHSAQSLGPPGAQHPYLGPPCPQNTAGSYLSCVGVGLSLRDRT